MNIEQKILKIAFPLLLNQGIKAITMDEIASKSKVSKKTIYKIYNSKEELVNAILHQFTLTLHKQVSTLKESSLNAYDEFTSFNIIIITELNKISTKFFNDMNNDYSKSNITFTDNLCTIIYDFIVYNIEKGIKQTKYYKQLNIDLIAVSYTTIYRIIFSDKITNMKEIVSSLIFINELLFNSLKNNKTISAEEALFPLLKTNDNSD